MTDYTPRHVQRSRASVPPHCQSHGCHEQIAVRVFGVGYLCRKCYDALPRLKPRGPAKPPRMKTREQAQPVDRAMGIITGSGKRVAKPHR
jgi:hypothetical protein